MNKQVVFHYVTGRGWVTSNPEHRCPECGYEHGRLIERQATSVEFELAIKPVLDRNRSAMEVRIEIKYL